MSIANISALSVVQLLPASSASHTHPSCALTSPCLALSDPLDPPQGSASLCVWCRASEGAGFLGYFLPASKGRGAGWLPSLLLSRLAAGRIFNHFGCSLHQQGAVTEILNLCWVMGRAALRGLALGGRGQRPCPGRPVNSARRRPSSRRWPGPCFSAAAMGSAEPPALAERTLTPQSTFCRRTGVSPSESNRAFPHLLCKPTATSPAFRETQPVVSRVKCHSVSQRPLLLTSLGGLSTGQVGQQMVAGGCSSLALMKGQECL